MSKSQHDEDSGCPCGTGHIVALHDKDADPEFSIPLRIDAFRDCRETQQYLDQIPANATVKVEVASASLTRFPRWLERYHDKHKES